MTSRREDWCLTPNWMLAMQKYEGGLGESFGELNLCPLGFGVAVSTGRGAFVSGSFSRKEAC